MSNQGDRFFGGFLAGTIFGGIVGGLVGTYLASRLEDSTLEDEEGSARNALEGTLRNARNLLRRSDDLDIEDARQGLEDKIAQLNDAIDKARQQLGQDNGTPQE